MITQREHLDPELPRELSRVAYPIHFLDFETLGPAIPSILRHDHIKPFLFSGPTIYSPGTGRSPTGNTFTWRQEIPGKSLPKVCWQPFGEPRDIVIYTQYEAGVIQALAEHLPRYRSDCCQT